MTPAKKAAPAKATPSLDELLKRDVDAPGNDVQEIEEGKDRQVNPDGVAFSGNANPINKTPADLATESPAETAQRFGISSEVPQHLHDNPNVVANKDMRNFQIPGGTHVHPDVARDNFNRNVGGTTERGEVTTTKTQAVYATENPNDDKGRKDAVSHREDREYSDGSEEPPYSDEFAEENKDDDKGRK